MENILYYAGQALGIVAIILGFVAYQQKTPRGIICTQLAVALVFSAHYFLIGAMTAAVLNFFGGVKCLFYYFRDKRGSKSLVEPMVFCTIVIISTILTWDQWYSALLMVGLVVDTLVLSLGDAQKARYGTFIKSPLCLVYNALVASIGGVVYECAVLSSSVLATVRYRKEKVKRKAQ